MDGGLRGLWKGAWIGEARQYRRSCGVLRGGWTHMGKPLWAADSADAPGCL